MEFVPVLALGTLVFTLMIFLKNLSAQQWGAACTQLIAWIAGIVGIFVMAATDFASGISIGDKNLGDLDFWSKVLVGLLATSLLSTLNEFKKALDPSDTAVVPHWFQAKDEAAARAHLTLPSQIATAEAMAEARRHVMASQPGKGASTGPTS